ncbi:hypothetical protein AAC387_Pa03g3321 [Persea americana]
MMIGGERGRGNYLCRGDEAVDRCIANLGEERESGWDTLVCYFGLKFEIKKSWLWDSKPGNTCHAILPSAPWWAMVTLE